MLYSYQATDVLMDFVLLSSPFFEKFQMRTTVVILVLSGVYC